VNLLISGFKNSDAIDYIDDQTTIGGAYDF